MTPLFSPDQWAYKRMHFGGAKPPDHLQCYPCTESTTGKDFGPQKKNPKKKSAVNWFHFHPFPSIIQHPETQKTAPFFPRHRSSGTEAMTASRASFRVQT